MPDHAIGKQEMREPLTFDLQKGSWSLCSEWPVTPPPWGGGGQGTSSPVTHKDNQKTKGIFFQRNVASGGGGLGFRLPARLTP